MSFGVSDGESAAGDLKITAESSNPDVVSADGVVFAGSGEARTLTLTPEEGAAGVSAVTVRATDPDGMSASHTINVNVTTVERSFRQMVNKAFETPADGAPDATTGVTWVDDAAEEPTAFDHLMDR